jgi:hypothetical protein
MLYTPFGLPELWEWIITCLIVLVVIPAVIIVHRYRSRKRNQAIDEVISGLRSRGTDS